MITIIKTIWKLLQFVAACLITLLILSYAGPKYMEWRSDHTVPTPVMRVEDTLFRVKAWVQKQLGYESESRSRGGFVPSRACEPNKQKEDKSSSGQGRGIHSSSRYDRNLKALEALQERLSKN